MFSSKKRKFGYFNITFYNLPALKDKTVLNTIFFTRRKRFKLGMTEWLRHNQSLEIGASDCLYVMEGRNQSMQTWKTEDCLVAIGSSHENVCDPVDHHFVLRLLVWLQHLRPE